jgi:hypothetical protein
MTILYLDGFDDGFRRGKKSKRKGPGMKNFRGTVYEGVLHDNATCIRTTVDEMLFAKKPIGLKLMNAGGHQYQRRHLDLIVYKTHSAKEFIPHWRMPPMQRPYFTDAHTYYERPDGKKGNLQALDYMWLMGGDYPDGSSFRVVDPMPGGFPDYTGDIHFGLTMGDMRDIETGKMSPSRRNELTAAVLSTKHQPVEPYWPKATISWPDLSDERVLLNASLRYGRSIIARGYPQLHLSDLADQKNRIEGHMVRLGLHNLGRFSDRIRQTGKSQSITRALIDNAQSVNWFSEVSKFKPFPYQQTLIESILQKPKGIPFYA